MRSRLYRIGTVAALILLLAGTAVYLYFPKTMSAGTVFLSNCNVTKDTITVQGGFSDSANKYSGYKLSYHDDEDILYIQMRGSLLSLSRSGGDIDIALPNHYEGIQEIYIQGTDNSDRVLAWPNQNQSNSL